MGSFLRYRDAYHPDWVVRAYEIAPPAFAELLQEELAWLGRFLACPLVEVGCGGGRILAALPLPPGLVVGVDLVLRYLAFARKRRLRVHWVVGDGLHLPLARGCWRTVIFAQATLGSLGEERIRQGMVTSLASLTAPGGSLLVTAYGPGARQAREQWYRAQQAEGLLPPFDEAATSGGTFAFQNGFVSRELSVHELQVLRPKGFLGEVDVLPSGLLAARWVKPVS